MASREYTVALTKASIPFRADLHARTAIADELQNPYAPQSEIVPQLIYAENVFPSKQGFDSLDEFSPVPDYVGAFTPYFDKIYDFFDENGVKYFFSPANGRGMHLKDGDMAWTSKLNLAGNPVCSRATRKTINYFWFRGFGPYRYNTGTTNYDAITFTSLNVATIRGITAASNYLLAYDNDTLYWTLREQVAAAVDFTPAVGIAGSTSILAVKGFIQAVLPFANGCIVYTESNAIMASYTGNPTTPFAFREIPGSAGVKREEEVAEETNIGAHFAWTGSGLQQITPDRAENIFPELNDFIKQRVIDSFNFDTGVLTQTTYSEVFSVAISVIGHRYLCISYGPTVTNLNEQVYLEALVYDLNLKRWGKLRVTHVVLFPYTFTGATTDLTYNDLALVSYNALATVPYFALVEQTAAGRNLSTRFASLGLAGVIKYYERSNLDISAASLSRLVIGRLSLLRGRISELNEIHMESMDAATAGVKVYSSDNWDPFLLAGSRTITPLQANYTGSAFAERWLMRATAKFHNVAVKGRFHLTTFLAWLNNIGAR